MAVKKHRRTKVMSVVVTLCLAYVSSYLILFRRGFAQADEWNARVFYFVTPRNETTWRMNWCLSVLYYPLIAIDSALGTDARSAPSRYTVSAPEQRTRP